MNGRVLIVDGHSIIFAWPELRLVHLRKDFSLARQMLVKVLTDYQDYTGVHVVAVFDGQGVAAAESPEPAGIQVFYSGTGQTADDVIERLVAKYGQRKDITVATSDMLEQQTASSFGAMCVSAQGLKGMVEEARADFERTLKSHAPR